LIISTLVFLLIN